MCDLIFDVMEARILSLETEKTEQENKIRKLEEEKIDLRSSLLEKIPECRVNNFFLLIKIQIPTTFNFLDLF